MQWQNKMSLFKGLRVLNSG